eukprot:9932050-Ditylum_brightwellii.AAC.2
MVSEKGDQLMVTGSTPKEVPPKNITPSSYSYLLSMSAEDESWVVEKISMCGRGSASIVVEGPKHGYKWITETATTLGLKEDQDAYHSELSGLYVIVATVEKLCRSYEITAGEIIVGCNGKGALRKTMDKSAHFASRSSQSYIIQAIKAKLRASSITWHWQHIKGNQDGHMGPLDRFESFNIEMDQLAKIRRAKDEVNNPPTQLSIVWEQWTITTNVVQPTGSCCNILAGKKVSTNLMAKLKKATEGKLLKEC